MSKCPWMCLLVCLAGASTASAQTITFTDPSGLKAEAEFSLAGGGTQLVVRFKNISTGVPLGFSNSDQLLTGLSFDLGAPGQQAGDPNIVSGSVVTGSASQSLNFSVANVGANADVSGEWGFGNGGTTNFHPNYFAPMAAGTTPFGGSNLDGPDNLDGPQGGLAPKPQPVVALGGLGAIQDEVVATLDLDQALANLGFLDNGVRVEYGSDAAFSDGDCLEGASATVVPDAGGFNANDALTAAPGSLPTIGNPAFTMHMDDPTNACGIAPGSPDIVAIAPGTLNLVLPNFGCTPGSPGTLMIDVLSTSYGLTNVGIWTGPGNPTSHTVGIPNDPSMCGVICWAQGLWVIPDAKRFVLTNRLDIQAGL